MVVDERPSSERGRVVEAEEEEEEVEEAEERRERKASKAMFGGAIMK